MQSAGPTSAIASNLLRDERKKRGMSVDAFAAACGISPSLVRHIEAGRRRMTAEVEQKVLAGLGRSGRLLSSSDVFAGTHMRQSASSGLHQAVLALMSLQDPRVVAPLVQTKRKASQFPKGSVIDLDGIADVYSAILEGAHEGAGNLTCYMEGLHPLAGKVDVRAHLSEVYDQVIARGGRVIQFVRSGHSLDFDASMLTWTLQQQLRFKLLDVAMKYKGKFLRGPHVHRFSRDLFKFDDRYIDAFPTKTNSSIEGGTLVRGAARQIGDYLEFLGDACDETIRVFGPDQLVDTLGAINDRSLSETRLVQSFITSATRPISEFRIGGGAESGWAQRIAALLKAANISDPEGKLESMAAAKKERTRAFEQSLWNNRFIQIVDQSTMLAWAEDGKRIDVPRAYGADDAAARVTRISNILRLLEQQPNFFVYVHPNLPGASDLTATYKIVDDDRHIPIAWQLEGAQRLLVVTSSTAIAAGKKPKHWSLYESFGEDDVMASIENEIVARPFLTAFEKATSSHSVERAKRQGIDFFQELQNRAAQQR